jgi:ubiquinone/menaquinone biosynthesis C-methylase UbiE
MEGMFSLSSQYYDLIYSFKDYQAEAQKLIDVIGKNLGSGGNRLLDVACGTGRHLEYLQEEFKAEGLDLDAQLLTLARQRNPGMTFHQADMINFDLGQRFDVVTCLFSSIGYTRTLENLERAVTCMARHLVPGGLLIIEPWFTPDDWHPNTVHALYIDEPELKIARVNTSFAKGRLSYFDLHYLIGTPTGTEHFVEHHELGLFTTAEMRAALAAAGLEVSHDSEGLMGRGLYLGLRLSS